MSKVLHSVGHSVYRQPGLSLLKIQKLMFISIAYLHSVSSNLK